MCIVRILYFQLISFRFSTSGLASFLAYNLLLVILCTVYAVKTRKLPDNFNESRFISMCAYTTLIIWLAFIPTYFTTSRANYKVLLLSLALILNDSIMLAFLYLPKVYAVKYVEETNMGIAMTSSMHVAPTVTSSMATLNQH